MATSTNRTFEIGDVTVGPGEVGRGALAKVCLAGSQELTVPVIVLNGVREGPTLLLMAACHGREVSGVRALLDALALMDPTDMSGRVIAIPVANQMAVAAGRYISPYDDVDVSSLICLPPTPDGTPSQRIAVAIQEACMAADYIIDMHAHPLLSFPLVLTCQSLVLDDQARKEYMRFAAAFGLPLAEHLRAPSSRTYYTPKGKPTINPELAGDLLMLDHSTSVGTRGFLNCAKAIGVLPGDPEPQQLELPPLDDHYGLFLVRINSSGFYKIHHDAGAFVLEGEKIATVFNHYGDILEEVPMPADGFVASWLPGYYTQTWAVSEGDDIAYVMRKLTPGEAPPGQTPGDFPGAQ